MNGTIPVIKVEYAQIKYVTSIDIRRLWCKDDPFVLPRNVRQVFYVQDTRKGKNWRVVELVRHRGVWDVPEQDELPHDLFQQDETEDGGVQINIEDFEVQHYKYNANSEIITVDEHMVVQVDGQDNEDDTIVRYVDEEDVDFSKLHDSDANSDVDPDADLDVDYDV